MQTGFVRLRKFAIVIGVAGLAVSGWASADPPSRVARLGYMTGAVSFSPAGENDWVLATINRPLTTGDRLWADAGARAELQVGGAMIRMNGGTGVSILNLDDRIVQLQLSQGTLNVRVRRFEPNQVFEVDTPNLAFTLRQPGEYRIVVDANGNATDIVVRNGQGEVYGEGASYVVDTRQPYRFTGTDLREYQYVDAPRLDEFDRWSSDRDRSYDSSGSARYVSQDVVGYQDLDANGTWRADAAYGNVWIPTHVAADWAPYRDGHWAWVDPWGWTWVDDAPWGFAVSHYGRWTNMSGTWGWVPGPVRTRAYYAPALVAFVGGSNFQLAISGGNVGGVAWFPLGPREVYRPSYVTSRGYFENINRSNTVINNTVINNYYNNSNVTNVVYANRQVPGAVVAVPTATFVQSQPVGRAVVRVTPAMVASAPVAIVPAVAPTERSVRGAASPAGDKPPARVFERPVVARTAPPAAAVGFAAQQQQLAAKPGKPLDDTARRELKPAAAAPTPVVKVVTPTQIAPPTARPPPTAPGAKPGDARGKSEERNIPAVAPAAPATSVAPPPAPPQRVAPPPVASPQVAPPVPPAQPPEQRGKPEQRGQPTAPPPAPPQRVAPPPVAPPQVAPPVPPAQTPEQRGKPDQPGQPTAPPLAPPQRVAPPRPPNAPSQVAPPTPTAQPSEQRGKPDQRGEQRGQPVAPPPAMQPPPAPPPQRVAPPAVAPPQQAVPIARPAPQPAKPELAPAARPPESRPPAAAPQSPPPAAAPRSPPPPSAQPAPNAQPRGQEPRPAAGKPDDKKKDSEEQKREDEARKQKG